MPYGEYRLGLSRTAFGEYL